MVLVAASNAAANDSSSDRDGRRNQFLSPSDIHILVVDDDRLSRAIVASLLRKCSYTGASASRGRVEFTHTHRLVSVTAVDSGVEAVEVLKQAHPGTYNLVLTVRG